MPTEQTGQEAALSDIWEKYLAPIKVKVGERAREIANSDGRPEFAAGDVFEALKDYVPGKPVAPERQVGWFNRNVTGFIGITSGLAIIFGLLGIVPFLIKDVSKDYLPIATAFLEIAKIFAGAIVGGAAASTAKR
jgi:hypothetical protein